MKKLGFTLAEVLVALGIIGVVSALAIPTFTMNSQNQANASKLSSVVANLENAFSAMMLEEDVDSFEETTFGADFNGDNLAQTLKILKASDETTLGDIIEDMGYSSSSPFKRFDGGGTLTLNMPNKNAELNGAVMTKSGEIVMFDRDVEDAHSNARLNNGASCGTRVGFVYIDVNGTNSPNKGGRDVFAFVLGGDGMLYPVGSKTASLLIDNNGNSTSHYVDNSGNPECNGNGFGCTARLIADGYKMNY